MRHSRYTEAKSGFLHFILLAERISDIPSHDRGCRDHVPGPEGPSPCQSASGPAHRWVSRNVQFPPAPGGASLSTQPSQHDKWKRDIGARPHGAHGCQHAWEGWGTRRGLCHPVRAETAKMGDGAAEPCGEEPERQFGGACLLKMGKGRCSEDGRSPREPQPPQAPRIVPHSHI